MRRRQLRYNCNCRDALERRWSELSKSTDGKSFTPLGSDVSGSNDTKVTFDDPEYARYLKLELTHDAGGLWWRIDDVQVRQ